MRRRLLVLAVGALLAMSACSDDDDGGGFSLGDGGGGGEQGQVPGPSGGDDGAAFSEASASTFVDACGNFDGATVSLCECAWGQITSNVSATEYAEFESAFLSDPSTPLPSWLTNAVAGCA